MSKDPRKQIERSKARRKIDRPKFLVRDDPAEPELRFHLGVHICKFKGCTYHKLGCEGVEGAPCLVERFFLEKFDSDPVGMTRKTGPFILGMATEMLILYKEYVKTNGLEKTAIKHPWMLPEIRALMERLMKWMKDFAKYAKDLEELDDLGADPGVLGEWADEHFGEKNGRRKRLEADGAGGESLPG
jgi:hypothetical protein